MSRRTYKDFGKPADEAKETSKRRTKKKRGSMKLLIRFMILCAVLLCLYALILNWKSIAPDSFVAWVDDMIDGTAGGSWPVSLTGDTVFDIQEAGANLVMVTDTATRYYNTSGGESVKRTCSYADPLLRVTDKYVLLLETGGNRYRLETRSRIELEKTVGNVIYTGAVSAKGDVAVVTDSAQSHISEVTVFSRTGDQRYQWLSSEWLVMDVSFSRDSNTLAVVGCRAQNGAMQSAILVFDLRGREEQPIQYLSDGVLFSRVQYMKSGTVVALGDQQARFVNPTGSLDTVISYEEVELIGFAFGAGDIAVITRPYGSQEGGTATVYSASGDVRTTQAFEGAYRDVAIMDNSFLVLSDRYLYKLDAKGLHDRAPVSADCLMAGAVEGKALVLGLTQLGEASWESKATTTKATTSTTRTTVATTLPPTTTTVSTTATTTTTAVQDGSSDESYSDEGYTDEEYSDEEYSDESYADEDYSDESYSDEEYSDESSSDESGSDEEYSEEAGSDESSSEEWYEE